MKNFGDLMKKDESTETQERFDDKSWLVVRVDGRGFSKYTKNYEKPFDMGFAAGMAETAKEIMKEFHACLAFTQSDEITLIIPPIEEDQKRLWDGKKQKLVSIIAAKTTALFIKNSIRYHQRYPGFENVILEAAPCFDCRIYCVENMERAFDHLIWRSKDGQRNAIGMLAMTLVDHKTLQKMSTQDRLNLIQTKDEKLYKNTKDSLKYGILFYYEPEIRNEALRKKIATHISETLTHQELQEFINLTKKEEDNS